MVDFDRHTGEVLDNYASALQSVEVIFTTRIGETLMLRHFGAGLIELLGRLMVPRLFTAFRTMMAAGIDVWEPRFRVRRIDLNGTVDEVRMGKAGFTIEVDWRPRGHQGDPTVEGVRTFGLRFVGSRVHTS